METKSFKMNRLFVLAVALMTISVNAWGTETEHYTYTFTQKQFEDNTTAKTLGTITWTPATTWGDGDGYWGYDGTKGQQWGSKNAKLNYVTITAGSSITNVSKVKVSASIASSGGCALSIKVGSTSLVVENSSNTSVSLTTTNTTYTFVATSPITGAVTITLTNNEYFKAQYIKDITIYTNTPDCTIDLDAPVVTATPGNGSATLTWPEVSHATGYKVSWNGGAEENPTGTRTYSKSGLINGTQYTWKVKAIGDATYCNSEVSGNVTPSANCTVTWKVDGETYTTGSPTTSVAPGGKVSTLPTAPATPASCGDAVFMGWTDHEVTNGSVPSPLFKTAGDAPVVNADVTYHAVFADEE